MLQNAPYHIRFVVTLILTVALAVGFRPLSKKLSQKMSSKHPIAEQELIGLGFVPLLAGVLMDSFLMAFQNTVLPFLLISVASLVGWGVIAFRWEPKVQKTWKLVLFHNLVPAGVFVLICVQQLGMGRFWSGVVGAWSQMFYLPVLNLGYSLTKWSTSLFPAYCASFLLMLIASFVGCQLGKRKHGGGREISKGYYIASALLLIWAIADFHNYATIGKDLVAYYSGESIIWELVQNTLIQGIVKALLAATIIVIGLIRAKRNKQLTALTAITGLLVIVMAVVWGAGMFCLTSITAEYAATRYLNGYSDFASTIATRSFEHWLGKGYDSRYENYDANRLWEAVDDGGHADTFHGAGFIVGEDDGFLNRPDSNKVYSATAVYDAEGNLLECSWSDFFYFEYLTEDQWNNREERSGDSARAFFEREMLTEKGEEIISNSTLTFDAAAMRFTGSFDGIEFTPCKIEYVDWDEFQNALHSKGSGQYTVSGVVEDYKLQWNTMYEDVSTTLSNGETITFYSDWFDVCYNETSPAFSHRGRDYDNVADLAAELGPAFVEGLKNLKDYDGLDLLIPSVNYCYSFDGETYYTPYYYGVDMYEKEAPELHFYTVSAVYCSPWRTAFGELCIMYLITLLLAVVVVLTARSTIKRHLIYPVLAVGEALVSDEEKTYLYPEASKALYESRLIQEGFTKYTDKIRMQKNEITRLNTALEYAKTAEQNRRQMTSNIAHELKTPLAVIHSYAEGLKEHIAEDKRDKYIDVILTEAERTDSMVLEMLDLSRLEAGKVKLSRDDFSLISLTQAIFEKLEMAARAKELQIEFSFPDDFTVTADEGRIAQVVENFATNAVKYTPAGGHILVKIQTGRSGTTFIIENDSKPLSDEALSKVWDTFYRTDEARSGGGTGLGLAIAKNIIDLHGGKCSARNTKTGVEFGFTLS